MLRSAVAAEVTSKRAPRLGAKVDTKCRVAGRGSVLRVPAIVPVWRATRCGEASAVGDGSGARLTQRGGRRCGGKVRTNARGGVRAKCRRAGAWRRADQPASAGGQLHPGPPGCGHRGSMCRPPVIRGIRPISGPVRRPATSNTPRAAPSIGGQARGYTNGPAGGLCAFGVSGPPGGGSGRPPLPSWPLAAERLRPTAYCVPSR